MQNGKILPLRAARVLRGLTQAQLAARVGRSQTWICQLESGLIQPSDIDVALVCRVLRVTPESVFPMQERKEIPVLVEGKPE